MTEFIPCRKCIGKSKIPGYILNDAGVLEECSCHKEWRLNHLLSIRCKESNIGNDNFILEYDPHLNYLGEHKEDILPKLDLFINRFADSAFKESTIYCYGDNGTQKTTLARWVGKELLSKGFSVYYTNLQSIIQKLVSFDNSALQESMYAVNDNIDLLIIDEAFHKGKVFLSRSGYEHPFLEDFLKDRLENKKKATIFISNSPFDTIEKTGYSISMENLIVRNVKLKGAIIHFQDVYLQYSNSVNATDIFSNFEKGV